MIEIRQLIWDEKNEQHIWERHHRTRAEVEEVCYGDTRFLYTEEAHDNRIRVMALGKMEQEDC